MSSYSNDPKAFPVGIYDGTDVPDLSFPLLQVGALTDGTVTTFLALWKTLVAGGWEAAERAIRDFGNEAKGARGAFNVTRHFWVVNGVGEISGLLLYTDGWSNNAVVVRGYLNWVASKGDVVLKVRDTHQNLEGKAVKFLTKKLTGK